MSKNEKVIATNDDSKILKINDLSDTSISENQQNANGLTDADYDNFASSFITREIIAEARLYRVCDADGRAIVGNNRQNCAGVVFPYIFDSFHSANVIRRDADDKPKYLAETGFRNEFYYPPSATKEDLQNLDLSLIFVEGQKKCLALYRAKQMSKYNFLPLALGGVDSFKTSKTKNLSENGRYENVSDYVADFHNIKFYDDETSKARKVYILFDTNCRIDVNKNVYFARIRLAKYLHETHRARVFLVDLEDVENKNLNGVDDLLGYYERKKDTKHAIAYFDALLSNAYEYKKYHFQLTDELSAKLAQSTKHKSVTLMRNKTKIALDTFDFSAATKRSKFIADAGITDENEKRAIVHFLINFADFRFDGLQTQNVETEKLVLSQTLSDNRVIEALSSNKFAVYNSTTNTVEYVDEIVDNNVRYKPLLTSESEKFLVDDVEDYDDEKSLVSEIESYIKRHYFIDEKEVKYVAYYILLTYLQDKLHTVPYLHLLGESGSGKSRLGKVIACCAYRGYFSDSITSSALFRMLTKYEFLTLFLDEFNLSDSDDAQEIVRILNAGYSRDGCVTRTNTTNFEVESFNVFSCKVIASLKKLTSDALESRCIDVKTSEINTSELSNNVEADLNNDDFSTVLDNNNLPLFIDIGQIEDDAKLLKRKLLMFRFRNINRNFTHEFKQADLILKKYKIRGRVIQKSFALFALITDIELKREFIRTMQSETKMTSELKKESFDFEVVNAIHEILFNTLSESEAELREFYKCEFNSSFNSENLTYDVQAADGEICEALTVENICERLNANRTEKDKIDVRTFARTLMKRFDLQTKTAWKRHSKIRAKSAVIFDAPKMARLFKTYNLPVSANFNLANLAKTSKPNEINELEVARLNSEADEKKFNLASDKSLETNELESLARLARLNLPEPAKKNKNGENEVSFLL